MGNFLTDDWFQKVDKGEITYQQFVDEAKRVGAYLGPAVEKTTCHTTITCRPYKCILEILKPGVQVQVIDDKQQVRTIIMETPSAPFTSNTILLCPFHQANGANHYQTVVKECALHEGFREVLKATAPNLFEGDLLKREYPFKWEFDRDRNFVVDIRHFPPDKLTAIRDIANNPRFEGRIKFNG